MKRDHPVDSAVEVAAKALYEKQQAYKVAFTPWDDLRGPYRSDMLSEARAALTAAMPCIRDQIVEELHMGMCTDPDCCPSVADAVEIVREGFEL